MLHGKSEEILQSPEVGFLRKNIQLIFTSPPFPLNRKKAYGNLLGEEYKRWLANFGAIFLEFLRPDGSIVIEVGNSWNTGRPTMSTLALEALLEFKSQNNLHLCQEFVCFNPARLPSPAQWVNVERIRVTDSFTRVWWLSPSERPKANNRGVLRQYSASMERLLERGSYNSGSRPSEHHIGDDSFLRNNGGSIPSNVLIFANTAANDRYQRYCKEYELHPHPARMPVGLADFFVRFLTDEGDVVLDPFAGSNTTGYAAETLRRYWVGLEPDEAYIQGSKGRFSSFREKIQK